MNSHERKDETERRYRLVQESFILAVKHALLDKNWTGAKLSNELGIAPSTWSIIANGNKKLSLEMMIEVALIVNIPINITFK